MITSKCKLCHKDSELQYSHIIPEFFYNPLYDSFHRFIQLNLVPGYKNKLLQKGIREYLLCRDCETQFSNYETYGRKIFYGELDIELDLKYEQNNEALVLYGVDYFKLKLLQLSILWRASVSTLPHFNGISLGTHEERIREMLIQENPGKFYEYCCFYCFALNEKSFPTDMILYPDTVRFKGYQWCRFLFGGMIWSYLISSHNHLYRFNECAIKEDGKLIIFKKQIAEVNFINSFFKKLKSLGKLDKNIHPKRE